MLTRRHFLSGRFPIRDLLVAGALVCTLTACSPARGGVTGISVDDQGRPVAVIAWCDTAPDRLTVFRTLGGNESVDDAIYTASPLRGGVTSVNLEAPGDGWILSEGESRLLSNQNYHASGWSDAKKITFGTIEFSLETVKKIKPGHVLIKQYDEKTAGSVDDFVTRAEFVSSAQRDCSA